MRRLCKTPGIRELQPLRDFLCPPVFMVPSASSAPNNNGGVGGGVGGGGGGGGFASAGSSPARSPATSPAPGHRGGAGGGGGRSRQRTLIDQDEDLDEVSSNVETLPGWCSLCLSLCFCCTLTVAFLLLLQVGDAILGSSLALSSADKANPRRTSSRTLRDLDDEDEEQEKHGEDGAAAGGDRGTTDDVAAANDDGDGGDGGGGRGDGDGGRERQSTEERLAEEFDRRMFGAGKGGMSSSRNAYKAA